MNRKTSWPPRLNLDDPVEYLTPPDQAVRALRSYVEKTAPVPEPPSRPKESKRSSAPRRKKASR